MTKYQRGISLVWVAVICMVVAGGAMLALMSVRQEKNLFKEGLDQAIKSVPAAPAALTAGSAPAAGGPLRKCVIDGQTVISNTDCKDSNKTSRDIAIHDTRGIEAPKVPPKEDPKAAEGSDPMLDKAIAKQTGERK